MRLRYGFLCDYAATMATGTNMVVGIFDRMSVPRTIDGGVLLQPHVIFVTVEDASTSPPRHLIGLRLVDADGRVILEREMPFTIGNPAGDTPGYPKAGQVTVRTDGYIAVPDYGAYEWIVSVDGIWLDAIPLTVAEAVMAASPL